MPSYLLDTNVIVRAVELEAVGHEAATAAIKRLLDAGNACFLAAQVIIEFWAVATRPQTANGLGWTAFRTNEAVNALLRQMPVLEDTPGVFLFWRSLVVAHGILGKRVHDARIVALMHVHRVTHLLTFNTGDFPAELGVVAVSPNELP